MNRTLLIVGAGPKALAIHLKANVLRELRRDAPDVVIIEKEKDQIGANWCGSVGYTDGKRELITPPEKDLGFPYRSRFGDEVDQRMARYSWQAFQISMRKFAGWIDHHRPRISHADLAAYLRWVADESRADIRWGHVKGGIRCEGNEWVVPYYPHGQRDPVTLRASGLVITGPGKPRDLPGRQHNHPSILNSETFWLPGVIRNLQTMREGDIAVVGSGDTAASAVVTLLDILPNPGAVRIHLFSKTGLIFSRSYSIGEVRWSTDPTDWHSISEPARQEFIKRTERAVFSDVLKSRIDAADNVVTRAGLVYHAEMKANKVRLTVNDGTHLKILPERYKRVVIATGFKRWSFQHWFDDEKQFGEPESGLAHEKYDNEKERMISSSIGSDLSYSNEDGWPTSKLYLPMLAGLKCGPGFPTLGCLGLLSDRVIESHLGSLV